MISDKNKIVENYCLEQFRFCHPDESELWTAKHKILKKDFTLRRFKYRKQIQSQKGSIGDKQEWDYENMKRQTYLLKRINAQCVPKCHKMIKTSNNIYLVYDLFPQNNLRQHLAKNSLNRQQKLQIMEAIAKTLQTLHSKNIILLALSLDNIYLKDKNQVFFGDWSLANLEDSANKIDPSFVKNKYQCIAPELLTHTFSIRSDIYSLGKIFQKIYNTEFLQSPSIVTEVITLMTRDKQNQRPSISEVIKILEKDNGGKSGTLKHSPSQKSMSKVASMRTIPFLKIKHSISGPDDAKYFQMNFNKKSTANIEPPILPTLRILKSSESIESLTMRTLASSGNTEKSSMLKILESSETLDESPTRRLVKPSETIQSPTRRPKLSNYSKESPIVKTQREIVLNKKEENTYNSQVNLILKSTKSQGNLNYNSHNESQIEIAAQNANKKRNMVFFLTNLSEYIIRIGLCPELGYVLLKYAKLTLKLVLQKWKGEKWNNEASKQFAAIMEEQHLKLEATLKILKSYFGKQTRDTMLYRQLIENNSISERFLKQKIIEFSKKIIIYCKQNLEHKNNFAEMTDALFNTYMMLKKIEEGSYEKFWDRIYNRESAFLKDQEYLSDQKKMGFQCLQRKISEILKEC